MTLDQWKSKGSYTSVLGHQIFTQEEGSGDTILLIHGFPTASWDWWQMWPELASRYHVLAIDMLGFGYSDKPKNQKYSILEQADIIEDFLAQKGVKEVKILCHDYGDTVAQELLARHEDRALGNQGGVDITSLCFLNGGLFPETHRALPIQKLLMSPIGWVISRVFSRKKLGVSFKKVFGPKTQPTESELDEFWSLITHKGGNRIIHKLIWYMQDRIDNRERWVGAMQKTQVPLRVIDGVVDPISGVHMTERYKELIPNPDIVLLDDIGHFPLIEAPKDVLKHYLEFINP